MDDQTTWKGHAFTLTIFTGIVVLCSIFFILGMLVGRSQGQGMAGSGVAEAAVEPPSTIDADATENAAPPELTFYESVEKNEPAPLEPPPPAANVTNFQIGAVRRSADAEKLLEELKQKGFRGFILAPPAGDPNPFYRVQVGPFTEETEAAGTKLQLESAGYKPIIRK